MRRARLIALTAAALLAAPQFSTAGPIGWGYTARVETDRGESFVHFGVETHHWYIPPMFPGESGQEGQTDYQIIANIAANSSGQHSGSVVGSPWMGGIHLTSVSPSQLEAHSIDNDWASQLPTSFWFRLRITDDASGEFRDLSYTMGGGASGFFTSGTGVVYLSVEDRTDTFALGGNQYTVRPRIRRSESADHIEMDVAVDPLTTPEPGTFALAGLGLFGAGVVRRLRRV